MTYVTLTVQPGQVLDQAARAEHKKTPDLKTLQGLVGGYIETVPHLTSVELPGGRRVRCTAYVNEEGRLMGMPKNPEMSRLWKSELLRQKPSATFSYEPELHGPVVFVYKAPARKAEA